MVWPFVNPTPRGLLVVANASHAEAETVSDEFLWQKGEPPRTPTVPSAGLRLLNGNIPAKGTRNPKTLPYWLEADLAREPIPFMPFRGYGFALAAARTTGLLSAAMALQPWRFLALFACLVVQEQNC